MKYWLLSVALLLAMPLASAMEFPGTDPGAASAVTDGATRTLSNQALGVTYKVLGGQIVVDSIEDKVAGKLYPQSVVSPVFKITTAGAGLLTDWVLTCGPMITDATVDPASASNGKHVPGKTIRATFTSPAGGVLVDWMAELRDGSGYVRSVVDIQGTGAATSLTEIELLCDLQIAATGAAKVGSQTGAVLRSDGMFFGVEMPFYWNNLANNRIRGGITTTLSLAPENRYEFASVMGVFPTGQLRRSFLHYNDRERARSYKPFLHYNCWFDLERTVSETGMIDRINAIHDAMTIQRGVALDSYVIDDGYDDYSSATGGFWAYDHTKFPNGFGPVADRLAQAGSHLGIWISPGGGYDGKNERFARGQEELGSNFTAWDLTIPEYGTWWKNRHLGHVRNDRANYFKWDQLGSSASGHFMKLMDVARLMRGLNPEVFVNTTVGTWQSPFWLNQIDCTWRGGNDMGFEGDGDERERWNTYRDRVSWDRMNETAQIYPLNALMNHGIVFANGHPFASQAYNGGTKDLRHEVRSFFGGGYALQELYLTPSLLGVSQWNAIAGAAQWAKNHQDVLVDAHFIGPSPAQNQVYGFAAWRNNKGALTLRNPSSSTKSFSLDIGTAFELPAGAAQAYALHSPYADQRVQRLNVLAGNTVVIQLQPFEVLVFGAVDDSNGVHAVLGASDPNGIAPQTIRFDASRSFNPSTITRYELDADSNGTIDSTNGGLSMFTYTTPGTHTATLTVFGAGGASDTVTKIIEIPATPPAVATGAIVPVMSVDSTSTASNGTSLGNIINGSGLPQPLTVENRLAVTHTGGLNLTNQYLSNQVNGTTFTFHFSDQSISEILIWNYSQNDSRGLDAITKVEVDTGSGFVDRGLSLTLLTANAAGDKAQVLSLGGVIGHVNAIRLTVDQASTGSGETAGGFNEVAFFLIPQQPRSYLSDLDWVSQSVGWGDSTRNDTSIVGNALTLGGTTYTKGIGTHANGEVIYHLGGGYTTFHAEIGVDDEIAESNPDGQVVFKVFGDDALLYASTVLGPADAAVVIDIDVTGVQTLRLVVDQGVNDYGDHADWADAYLVPTPGGFSAWAASHGVSAYPYADDDSDALSNFIEYAMGLNPNVNDSAGATTLAVDESDAVVFRFPVAVGQVNSTVEYSSDFQTWSPYNGALFTDGIDYWVRVPKNLQSDDGCLFLRLKLNE